MPQPPFIYSLYYISFESACCAFWKNEAELVYNIVLVSGVQQNNSDREAFIQSFPIRGYHKILTIAPSAIQ